MYYYGSYSNKGIKRFLEAQKKEYEIAHKEIAQGKKESHWIWYIYPQIKGLGMSYMDQIYSIKSIQEGLEYKNDEILFKRLLEMTKLLLEIKHNNIKEVIQSASDSKELEALRHTAKAEAWMNEGSAGKAVVDFMISKGE